MTANDLVSSAAPDELAVRLARIGLPARGARDRQAGLSGPLQAFHMTRRSGRIRSDDPTSGQEITVEVDDQGWHWQPPTTVVLAGSVAGCCCPYINFHASPDDADAYRQAHPAMAAEVLEQAEAVAAARRIFGGLLHPGPSHDPVESPAT